MAKKTIALVGNPNSGKTTFFNALTGLNQHVGNWPGVTVDKKEGSFKYKNEEYTVVDLPGTYSLGAFSEDEVVARDFILTGNPDVVINIVDSSNLERSLYLTSQLLEMEKNVVLALNMVDESEKKGISFDLKSLAKKLDCPVLTTVASKKIGMNEIIEASVKAMDRKEDSLKNPIVHSEEVLEKLDYVENMIENVDIGYPKKWTALKALENDKDIITKIKAKSSDDFNKKFDTYLNESENLELKIIDKRYDFANKVVNGSIKKPKSKIKTTTDKIDKFITNKYLGIPIFAAIMFFVFQITFKIGQDLLGGLVADGMEALSESVEALLVGANAPELLTGFIINGIFGGVGTVVEFVPLIAVLYLLLGLLEDSGYMARAAYVWDDLMRKLGLQGKAFVSMIIGFGCNVPGIMSTRTLDNKKDRMITTLINPFMSCGAKIPIYSVFIAAFFENKGGLILFTLYFTGIFIGLLMAKIFSKTLFKGESSYFIMELPPYRIPTVKNVLKNMWDNVSGFLKRAGTTIFIVVALLWVLAVLPTSQEPYSEFTILGKIGQFIAPIFALAGYGTWQASVSLFAGIPAKEAVVGTLGMLYAGQYVEEGAILVNAIQQHFTPLTAVSFMVMTLLYTPCAAVLGTVKKETGSTKWTIFTALYTFAIGWICSVLVFQIGTLLGFK